MFSKLEKLFLMAVVALIVLGLIGLAAGNLHLVGGITPVKDGTPLVPVSTYCGGNCDGQPATNCPDWAQFATWQVGPSTVTVRRSKSCEGYSFVVTVKDAPYNVEMADGDISDSLAITAPGSYPLHDIVGSGSGVIQVIDSNGGSWVKHFTLQ